MNHFYYQDSTARIFPRPRVGISQCLLGDPVRYDGRDKRSAWCTEQLSRIVDLIAFCPEVGSGLGVPRAPIHWITTENGNRLVDAETQQLDFTEQLSRYYDDHRHPLAQLSGYVLMQKSPSCGLNVALYDTAGATGEYIVGAFAQALQQQLPYLPLVEEQALATAVARDHFLVRVFALARWQQLFAHELTAKALQTFHSQYKYLLMAHSTAGYRTLGPLLANLKAAPLADIALQYRDILMDALSQPASRGNTGNALQHISGYLRRHLSSTERQALREHIEAFRRGESTYSQPLALLQHYFQRFPNAYIAQQALWQPYPAELEQRHLF